MTPKQRAARLVRVHETGVPGKWTVGLWSSDGCWLEYCSGIDTKGDAAAVAQGFRTAVANAVRMAMVEEIEACAQTAEWYANDPAERQVAERIASSIRFRLSLADSAK